MLDSRDGRGRISAETSWLAMSSTWTNSTAPGPDADESSMANMFVLVAAMSGLVCTAAVDNK